LDFLLLEDLYTIDKVSCNIGTGKRQNLVVVAANPAAGQTPRIQIAARSLT
jgi:hypothetical protein